MKEQTSSMTSTVRKRKMGTASATAADSAKRVRLPDYAGDSPSTSGPRLGRLGLPARHTLDNSPSHDKGLQEFSGMGLFTADDDPDASGARSSQPLPRKELSSRQNPDADAHRSLPSSSLIPDSTFHTIPSTDTAGLSTRNTLSSSEAPAEQYHDHLPDTLSKYERKLKKFVGQWHASLVKKGIPEHLVHELAKQCIQTNDEEDDSETDSQRDASRMKKPLVSPTPGLLSRRGTQLVQASTQVSNNHQDNKEDGGIPSRSSANRALTQTPRTGGDEPIVVRLGAGGRTQKQGLSGDKKPATLVEALRAKSRHKKHGEEGDDAFDSLAVARRLQRRDFGGKLSSHDICVIGMAVLHEVFGGKGQKRLADTLTHLYGHHPRQHLADLSRNAGRVADEIRKSGPEMLSSFTLRWAQAVQHDSPNMSTVDDIRLADMKVSLVREWDYWSSQAAIGSEREIEDFLAKNGLGANTGALSIRIAKYLSRQLGLPDGILAKKIYAWRPLTVMADVFGDGIYVFVSRSLFTCYNKLHPTHGIKKEDKFRAMALAVADELPDLLEICKASYTHIVQPVLKSRIPGDNNIQDLSRDLRVPGVQMATYGHLYSLRKTSIPQLHGIHMSLSGFVEELGNVAGGDIDAEITLVRQQSLQQYYKEGNNSDSNSNNNRSGSGEEYEDYNE
ncbi:hypothetical protein FPOAC2_13297 [Fusarium poae]